jgi:hypothetical protein
MLRIVSACVLLLALLPAPAAAEWHFVPLIGLTFKGQTNIFDESIISTDPLGEAQKASDKTHPHLAGAVSLLGSGILGVEAFATWAPGFFQMDEAPDLVESSRTATLMGNLVLTTPRKWTEYGLRPYASGGFGLVHATVKRKPQQGDPPFDPIRMNSAGYNFGFGAIGFFSERTGVRFDFRYHSTMRRNSEVVIFDSTNIEEAYLRYMTVSVGVVFRRR